MGVSITVVAAWHILDDDEVNTIHHMKNDDYLRRESFLTGEKQGPIWHSHFSLSREKKTFILICFLIYRRFCLVPFIKLVPVCEVVSVSLASLKNFNVAGYFPTCLILLSDANARRYRSVPLTLNSSFRQQTKTWLCLYDIIRRCTLYP